MKRVNELLKQLPAVHQLLSHPQLSGALEESPRPLVVETAREALDIVREEVLKTEELPTVEVIADKVAQLLADKKAARLRRVINATGVVLHTNLGRAVLSGPAIEAVARVAGAYSNLEYDLDSGSRGSRHSHIEGIVAKVTGASGAMVVNNNAAAVLLVLSALAKGREAIVSRGELVEIGGAFRVPEVMEQSGTVLREVGSTNKTYLRDYQAAVNEETGLLLKVHTSNYRVVGFTHETSREELVRLGNMQGIPVVEDLGSGSLIDLGSLGQKNDEPTVQACLSAGVDLVTFSGDKLLGGPQAGFIVGRKELVDKVKRHPLARAVRVDKMTIAALEATLRAYLDPEQAVREIPTLRMLMLPTEEIKILAEDLADRLQSLPQGCRVSVMPGKSRPGGGALPTTEMDTWLVVLQQDILSTDVLAGRLRGCEPPLLVRIQEERILMDPRTMLTGDAEQIKEILTQVLAG